MRLLLISNSTNHGESYLDHCIEHVADFLSGIERLLFVPYALQDRDGYARVVRERLAEVEIPVDALHESSDPIAAIARADAVFVGGGNTFRLLRTLQVKGLVPSLRERVRAGLPYLGSSAGTNLAGPTIRTTNDMPIVEPESFAALGFVPFQINPHYLDPDPASTHMGETRETRIREFLEENPTPVLGLREGCLLRREGASLALLGPRPARLFRRGQEPEEIAPGSALDFLLEA